ncbi:hypothetical protein [Phaeobacter sp. 11ANDIMAR09]|uniref:hypothetical protein n=1 Tax=Phaeobacter sp. 11ANDIMAR09 TaxID=1225647 RepID=UPI0006C8D63A|nr:hypothetical protein [Phaeobacter sp. 11ANDIMAR09]KPD13142.1 hypothetical protein AN476_07570 [Phaeobacter sp. 11ANDIMAR09]
MFGNFLVDIDWLKASEDQRKQLYVATRAVADAGSTTVEEIMDVALGRKALMGTDYLSTFRRGKIRKSYAKLIHGWIAENHIEIANNIAPGLFPLSHTDAWGRYLAEHAIHGRLRIARFGRQSFGLVQRKKDQPKPDEVLKLGEEFCFHLDSDIYGYAVAFQEYKGTLHPLPLGSNGELHMQVQAGEQILPIKEDGKPDKLTEMNDLGQHLFIISVASQIAELPTPTSPNEFYGYTETHLIKVEIVP